MSKEEAIKQYKSLFPDNVETIVLTKEDYDRQLGKLQYENIELQERIDKAIEYIDEHIKYECDNAFNGMQFYSYHLYDFNKEELLDILTGGKNE